MQLLAKHIAEREAQGEEVDEEAEWDNWELDSVDSDSSGGWQDVSSDGSDLDISDSDDDEEDKRRAKKRKLDKQLAKAQGKVVDVAGTLAQDTIKFDDDDEEEEEENQEDEDSDSDDEKENVAAEPAAPVGKAVSFNVDADDGDEMSLTRANKVLEGTDFLQLAMTKVSGRQRMLPRLCPVD